MAHPTPEAIHSVPSPKTVRPARAALVCVFALLMAGVRVSGSGGDTYWYALDIRSSLGHGWTESPRLWDFAHLLWRPLGRVLALGFLPLVAPRFGGDLQVSITFLLMMVNLAAALACGLLLQQAIWKMTARPWLSALAAMAFFGLDPVLSFSRAGTPYLSGLALTFLAVWLAGWRPASGRIAVVCGLLCGTAALLWVPYIFTLPAVLLVSPLLNYFGERWRLRVRFAVLVCLTAGVLIAGCYVMAMVCRHVSSWADFHAWMSAEAKYSRNRTLLRLPGGLARSFYNLGDDTVWLKWYLFHDPYARVGVIDLVRAIALKLALFYAALASLIVLLWRSFKGKRLLLLALVVAIPHLALALAYESGDPGRYVPLLLFVLLPFGYGLAGPELSRGARSWLAVLFFAPMLVNVASALTHPPEDQAREAAVAGAPKWSTWYVLNLRDDLLRWRYPSVFRLTVPQTSASIVTLDSFSGLSGTSWQSDFACAAWNIWAGGGELWVTDRILAARPQREWLWIEGDSPAIIWEAFHRFFMQFARGEERAAPDGFFLIPPDRHNLSLVTASLPATGRESCPAAAGADGQSRPGDAPIRLE